MRSRSPWKVSWSPYSLGWPQAKQRWYVVSSLSLSRSCTAADQFISRSGGSPILDRRSEALAQLLEAALSEQFALPANELLQAMPVPVAVVHAKDLRALAVNELMAGFLHRADAAGLTMSGMLPPAHPLSDPRPYRAVATDGTPVATTIVGDGHTWAWFTQPLKGESSIEYLLTGLVAQPAAPLETDVARLRDTNATKTEFLSLAAH